jgi:6-phosphofructokinase
MLLARRWEVVRIESGYRGLLEGRFRSLGNCGVGGILHRGGTVLGTARSPEFTTSQGQGRVAKRLKEVGIEGLIVIGGEGSLTGALRLEERGVAVVGFPATIDNDMWGTDTAIGVNTGHGIEHRTRRHRPGKGYRPAPTSGPPWSSDVSPLRVPGAHERHSGRG